MMMESAALLFTDIKLGAVYQFTKQITKEELMSFARISGNYNPLHVDEEYGKKSKYGRIIVHGMLAASYFSALLGMYCPGERGVCLSQTLQFKLPIYYDDIIIVRGTVIEKNELTQMITLRTEVIRDGKVAIDGEAKTILLDKE